MALKMITNKIFSIEKIYFEVFNFEKLNTSKSERARTSTLRDWPPCPPIQRGGGRRSRPGVTPFISALTVARCPATFPGVWPQLRDTLSTSRSVGRGTGAFIYALSADENRPALAAPRHTSTALFSCRPSPAATAFSRQRRQSV